MTDDEYTAWLDGFTATEANRWKHLIAPLRAAHHEVQAARQTDNPAALQRALQERSRMATRLDVAQRTHRHRG